MTPAPVQASTEPYQGPKKFTAEEIEDGNRGIRWVTDTYVAGRPTSHDLMEYLQKRGDGAMCGCDKCKTFFATPAPVAADTLTDEQIDAAVAVDFSGSDWADITPEQWRNIARTFAALASPARAIKKD